MERDSMIKRVDNKKDRRQKFIYLTEHGLKLESQLVILVEKTYNEAHQGFTTFQSEALKAMLNQLIKNIRK